VVSPTARDEGVQKRPGRFSAGLRDLEALHYLALTLYLKILP
jgi:hypothetical protein